MIPVNEPLLGERELEYVVECVRTGWISSAGRFIGEFEDAWARYCGRSFGVAVTNGSAALQLAIASLDLRPGDEVIMPSFTIISCAAAILESRAVPVLVDSDPETWCMDVDQVEAVVTPRTRAIMPVHIYGHPVDMKPLLEIAESHQLVVIEDAAEAHGAEYLDDEAGWLRCGGFGLASCFSFYANKLVTTGEGGMIVTDDEALAERLRLLRNLAFDPARRFHHERLGFNFRLTNMQAAVGLAQVERIAQTVARKRKMAARYLAGLSDVPGLQLPVERPWARSVFWMLGVVVDEETGMTELQFAERLRSEGVDTRPFFLGMHEQPALLDLGLFQGQRFLVAERLARQGLYLPSGLALTDDQIDTVCDAVRGVLT
jgi:perosamine synthetase